MKINKELLRDKIYACWLGKNIGGTMGAPFEGQKCTNNATGFTHEKGAPLPNDDLDLQLVWLKAISEVGPQNLNSKILGEYWLTYIGPPWNEYGVCKANMRMGIIPPLSGEIDNHLWRNSNGAWIRTEIWACLYPAMPESAINFAFEDASVDHGFGEGTFAAVFVAAIQSSAFVINDLNTLLAIGLSKIPADCHVARSVKLVMDHYKNGKTWQEAREALIKDSEDLGWFQAPANVAYVVLGLLYGQGDFKKSMLTAINCGDDTDCTGATVGAILGIMNGTKGIPQDWQAYIGDRIITIAVILGSAWFPGSCTELTDSVMKLLPVTTYPGLKSTPAIEIVNEPVETTTVDPASFMGDSFIKSVLTRSRHSFTYETACTKALIEFDGPPQIQPNAEIALKVTVTHTRCVSYNRYELRWLLPEGFSVISGKTNLIAKWGRGADNVNIAEVKIKAGEKVQPINRLILEITSPSRAVPLLVPITLLA
ncbi:MAG: ADP-ribosylglycohydrolase family protein [Phycisphaerales bacterium]|nr:ADP-ribosylglycohydrolase family protein [Phycisphaerales bacterium]